MKRALFVLACVAACSAPKTEPPDAGQRPPLTSVKHAHNDYEHTRPLFDALDHHFESVEADIWFDGSDGGSALGVAHDGPPFKGSLQALYLEPLKARLAANNSSVYGDGKDFYLWLDLKDSSSALQDELVRELSQYDFLTLFPDTGDPMKKAITVVLTGGGAKVDLVNRPAPRPYIRDGEPYSASDPPADGKWGYYAVFYYDYLQWVGDGTEMPKTQVRIMEDLIAGAHAKGRKIRIYSSPDVPAYWNAALDAGEDFVNADDLAGLEAAYDAYSR
ncbi:MAG: hypothetical protein QM723_09600 [Myxococcaceae bacterium]